MQYISFMYKEFRPILLSGLKIQNAFKNAKWVCACLCQLTRNFT
jgi:hypothetical protein